MSLEDRTPPALEDQSATKRTISLTTTTASATITAEGASDGARALATEDSAAATAATAATAVTVFRIFDLTATDPSGNELQPVDPVTMVFTLDPDDITDAGSDLSTVGLAFFDPASDAWVAVSCTPSGSAEVSCQLPHFSTWLLYALADAAAPPGHTGAPTPADTGMGADSGASNTMAIVLALAALTGILGLGTRFALARRQS